MKRLSSRPWSRSRPHRPRSPRNGIASWAQTSSKDRERQARACRIEHLSRRPCTVGAISKGFTLRHFIDYPTSNDSPADRTNKTKSWNDSVPFWREPGLKKERMSTVAETTVPSSGARKRQLPLSWLGVTPFFIFAILFLIWPTMYLIIGAFQDPAGNFTLQNIYDLFQPQIMSAYWISIKVSLASAVGGAIIGFFLAWSVVLGNLPRWLRPAVLTFSGVASNFAGIPLAFAFLATLGRTGLVTVLLREWFGFNLYSTCFNLLSFWGLTITYLFFQIPLMVLILTPALDGLKKEWREASSILGATNLQYWRMVAFPILWPSLLGTTLLLFANAFG